jgi:leucyl aminopeptidase
MRLRLDGRPLQRVAAEMLAIAVPDTALRRIREEPAAGAAVARELVRQGFKAGVGSSVLLRAGVAGTKRPLAILGLGPAREVDAEACRRAAAQLVARAREVRARSAAVAVVPGRDRLALGEADVLGALAEGAGLASYAFSEYRRDAERVPLGSLVLAGVTEAGDGGLRRAVRRADVLVTATNCARTWVNEPAAVMTPSRLADEAMRVGKAAGLEVHCEGPGEIARRGMGALLGVSRGSAEEPRFIRLTYRPASGRGARAGSAPRRIALVGKGITFDSGGLSLKPAGAMEHMKRDMAGGAAVIAAMTAIAALRPPVEVRAYVPASENLPGGGAIKPGDVVRTVTGKTVEVVNTDAEGRLVLADALGVAVCEAPDVMVDIATLTGAIRSALGTRVGGIMGSDPALVRALVAAGSACGERLWELPLVPAYGDDLESEIADLRNIARDPHGGAIHAGLFLRAFVGDTPWAHLDIAGVAFTDRDLPCVPRGGVGFGVRLLVRWVLATAAGDGDEPRPRALPLRRRRGKRGASGPSAGGRASAR